VVRRPSEDGTGDRVVIGGWQDRGSETPWERDGYDWEVVPRRGLEIEEQGMGLWIQ